jgi:hypothetical protein
VRTNFAQAWPGKRSSRRDGLWIDVELNHFSVAESDILTQTRCSWSKPLNYPQQLYNSCHFSIYCTLYHSLFRSLGSAQTVKIWSRTSSQCGDPCRDFWCTTRVIRSIRAPQSVSQYNGRTIGQRLIIDFDQICTKSFSVISLWPIVLPSHWLITDLLN